jgi:hypothetical protein
MRASVRGYHAYFKDPYRVGQRSRCCACQSASDEVIASRGTSSKPTLPRSESALEARLEKEERGPTRGISDKIRR